jgi:hypothetical protein
MDSDFRDKVTRELLLLQRNKEVGLQDEGDDDGLSKTKELERDFAVHSLQFASLKASVDQVATRLAAMTDNNLVQPSASGGDVSTVAQLATLYQQTHEETQTMLKDVSEKYAALSTQVTTVQRGENLLSLQEEQSAKAMSFELQALNEEHADLEASFQAVKKEVLQLKEHLQIYNLADDTLSPVVTLEDIHELQSTVKLALSEKETEIQGLMVAQRAMVGQLEREHDDQYTNFEKIQSAQNELASLVAGAVQSVRELQGQVAEQRREQRALVAQRPGTNAVELRAVATMETMTEVAASQEGLVVEWEAKLVREREMGRELQQLDARVMQLESFHADHVREHSTTKASLDLHGSALEEAGTALSDLHSRINGVESRGQTVSSSSPTSAYEQLSSPERFDLNSAAQYTRNLLRRGADGLLWQAVDLSTDTVDTASGRARGDGNFDPELTPSKRVHFAIQPRGSESPRKSPGRENLAFRSPRNVQYSDEDFEVDVVDTERTAFTPLSSSIEMGLPPSTPTIATRSFISILDEQLAKSPGHSLNSSVVLRDRVEIAVWVADQPGNSAEGKPVELPPRLQAQVEDVMARMVSDSPHDRYLASAFSSRLASASPEPRAAVVKTPEVLIPFNLESELAVAIRRAPRGKAAGHRDYISAIAEAPLEYGDQDGNHDSRPDALRNSWRILDPLETGQTTYAHAALAVWIQDGPLNIASSCPSLLPPRLHHKALALLGLPATRSVPDVNVDFSTWATRWLAVYNDDSLDAVNAVLKESYARPPPVSEYTPAEVEAFMRNLDSPSATYSPHRTAQHSAVAEQRSSGIWQSNSRKRLDLDESDDGEITLSAHLQQQLDDMDDLISRLARTPKKAKTIELVQERIQRPDAQEKIAGPNFISSPRSIILSCRGLPQRYLGKRAPLMSLYAVFKEDAGYDDVTDPGHYLQSQTDQRFKLVGTTEAVDGNAPTFAASIRLPDNVRTLRLDVRDLKRPREPLVVDADDESQAKGNAFLSQYELLGGATFNVSKLKFHGKLELVLRNPSNVLLDSKLRKEASTALLTASLDAHKQLFFPQRQDLLDGDESLGFDDVPFHAAYFVPDDLDGLGGMEVGDAFDWQYDLAPELASAANASFATSSPAKNRTSPIVKSPLKPNVVSGKDQEDREIIVKANIDGDSIDGDMSRKEADIIGDRELEAGSDVSWSLSEEGKYSDIDVLEETPVARAKERRTPTKTAKSSEVASGGKRTNRGSGKDGGEGRTAASSSNKEKRELGPSLSPQAQSRAAAEALAATPLRPMESPARSGVNNTTQTLAGGSGKKRQLRNFSSTSSPTIHEIHISVECRHLPVRPLDEVSATYISDFLVGLFVSDTTEKEGTERHDDFRYCQYIANKKNNGHTQTPIFTKKLALHRLPEPDQDEAYSSQSATRELYGASRNRRLRLNVYDAGKNKEEVQFKGGKRISGQCSSKNLVGFACMRVDDLLKHPGQRLEFPIINPDDRDKDERLSHRESVMILKVTE